MSKSKKPFVGASILIIAGVLLLLNNLGLISTIPSYVLTWKMLLIVIGVLAIFKRHWFMALTLIGIGTYFLLPDVFGIAKPEFYTIWPVLLIFVGFMVIFHQLFPNKRQRQFYHKKKQYLQNKTTESSDYLDSTVILSGDFKKISSYNFQGGKIACVLGGTEIDLTNCCLSKETNVIEVDIVMGGLTLTVPKEWNVKIEVSPIMGGVFDEVDSYIDPAAEITIKGTVVMGGIEIKRA